MKTRALLGIDVGGTKSAVLVGNDRGEIIARREWPSHSDRGPKEMLREIETHARELLRDHAGVVAAGVSIGGPLDALRGVIFNPPNLPGWNAVRLKARLQKSLALPVNVTHDAAACALAEYRWGAGRGHTRVVYLTCGTGFGVGLVFDGKIYYGADGSSPEIGHWRYADDGPMAFEKRGSVEAFCSGSGLSKLAAWKFPARWRAAPPSGAELSVLAYEGDADSIEILRINAHAIGHVSAKLADLLRPDCIILGSLSRHLGSAWLGHVRKSFVEEALPDSATRVQLIPSQLAERLQDCSALAAALEIVNVSPNDRL